MTRRLYWRFNDFVVVPSVRSTPLNLQYNLHVIECLLTTRLDVQAKRFSVVPTEVEYISKATLLRGQHFLKYAAAAYGSVVVSTYRTCTQ
jgi:hypothetical protein